MAASQIHIQSLPLVLLPDPSSWAALEPEFLRLTFLKLERELKSWGVFSIVKTVVHVVGRGGNRRRVLAKVSDPNFVELCVDDVQHLLLPHSCSGLGCKG